MPRFINQASVPMKMRRPHLERYRRMLRESLHNPGLAQEQRAYIKEQLAQVGQPKVYGPRARAVQPKTDSEPVVESATPESSAEALPDADALAKLTKAQILEIGESEGAEVSMRQTKAQMIETVIANR